MLYEVESRKTLEEIERDLKEAAARHRFGVLAVHDLKQTLANKGVEYAAECRVYEICNPQQAKRALEASGGAVSSALPCRISVYREGPGYRVSTMLPTAMMSALGKPGLEAVAGEVERDIRAMMEEAAGRGAEFHR